VTLNLALSVCTDQNKWKGMAISFLRAVPAFEILPVPWSKQASAGVGPSSAQQYLPFLRGKGF